MVSQVELSSFVIWENWRLQKDVLKLTDLKQWFFFLGLFDFNQQIHNGFIIQSTIKYGQIIRQN